MVFLFYLVPFLSKYGNWIAWKCHGMDCGIGSLLDWKRGNEYMNWARGARRGFVQGFFSTLWPLWLIEIKLLWPLNMKLLFIQVARKKKNRMNFPFCEFSCILKYYVSFITETDQKNILKTPCTRCCWKLLPKVLLLYIAFSFSPSPFSIYLTLISITLASSFPRRVGWAYYNDLL